MVGFRDWSQKAKYNSNPERDVKDAVNVYEQKCRNVSENGSNRSSLPLADLDAPDPIGQDRTET